MKPWIGVLGNPLAQSRSQEIHEQFIKAHKRDWEFRLLEWTEAELDQRLSELKRDSSCVGFSVTMPYKERVLSLADELDVLSKKISVVNCIKNKNGKWTGYNTDALGFLEGWKEWRPNPLLDLHVIFIGCGSTAKTLSITLANLGYRKFTYLNRTEAKITRWKEAFESLVPGVEVEMGEWGSPLRSEENALVLNTVPVELDWFYPSIFKACWVFDVTYNPQETPLLKWAKQHEFPTLSGWPMFRGQAKVAFEIWSSGSA